METTRLTGLFTTRLIIAVAFFLVLPGCAQFQQPLPGQQLNFGVPAPVPSFVYYRDPKVPDGLLFSPINTDYKEFRTNGKLRGDVQPPVIPSSLPLVGIPSNGFVSPNNNAFSASLNSGFSTTNNNGFNNPLDVSLSPPNKIGYNTAINNGVLPPNYFAFSDPINNGFLLPNGNGYSSTTNNGFSSPHNKGINAQTVKKFKPLSYNNLYPTANNRLNSPSGGGLTSLKGKEFLSPERYPKSLSEQVSLLRYADNFPLGMDQQQSRGNAVTNLSPTVQQRQRNVENAGQLLHRQRSVGSKPFLTSHSDSVQREGGEVLSSSGGYLGQPHRGPTFVTSVGTPVSGVGQSPLFTGDSVQGSTLDETSDVRGVKNPGGIPAPGRLPVSEDVFFAGTGLGYANNFGYSVYEGPRFRSFPPPLVTSRGPLALGSGAFQGGFVTG